jgi:hypothetical protein
MRDCLHVRLLGKLGGPRRMLGLLLLAGLLAGLGGCTRVFYRRQADREVNDILAEKDSYPAWWKIQQYHVYPDPRARYADPTNPDHPPMPTDDQAAWQLSPHPQQPGRAGVGNVSGTGWLEIMKVWDTENREQLKAAQQAEKPEAAPPAEKPEAASSEKRSGQPSAEDLEHRPVQTLFDRNLSPEGFLLTLDQAVELGLINAREYQSIREDLYLACLPVTLQRFSFAFQWSAIVNAFRQWAGLHSLEGPQNNWTVKSNVGVSKLFSTGALLTTAFANNTVFNFLHGGGPHVTSVSTINLDFVQPLLAGGGKAVTLEPLTQVERNLLYEIRGYARYREQFYVAIAIGTTLPGTLPAAAGGAGGGGPISVLAALGIPSTDVSGVFRGYYPTLYRQLDMAVDQKYALDLERALLIFEGFQEGGQVSPLQVSQVQTSLLNARNAVLKDYQDKTNALDQFKLQLGIPINLPLVLDDTPGRQITRQFDRYYEVLAQADAAYKLVEKQRELPPEKLRPFLRRLFATDPVVRGTEFQKKLPPLWAKLSQAPKEYLRDRLEQLDKEKRKLLDLKTDLELKGQSLSPEQLRALDENAFEADLASLETVLREYEARPWQKLEKEKERRAAQLDRFRRVSNAAVAVLVFARNERLEQVGTLWPGLPNACLDDFDMLNEPVEKAEDVAVRAALASRVDLMNARAQVVDAWRQLRVTANALMGVFNVGYHLDSTTPAGHSRPLAFAASRTNQELTLNGQLPLVRIAERNAYRTALIDYQRARRALMSLEDNLAAQVRFDVRQLHLFAANYKIQQKVVEQFYLQVENAREVLFAPTAPAAVIDPSTAAANAAALTNQYLQALSGLNNAQTAMYRLWLSFLATRMELYLDLERLPLDNRGVWIDESGNSADGSPCGGGACLGQSPGGPARGPATLGGAALGQPLPGDERRADRPEPVAGPRLLPPTAGPALE